MEGIYLSTFLKFLRKSFPPMVSRCHFLPYQLFMDYGMEFFLYCPLCTYTSDFELIFLGKNQLWELEEALLSSAAFRQYHNSSLFILNPLFKILSLSIGELVVFSSLDPGWSALY
jgi:hypothetical protein